MAEQDKVVGVIGGMGPEATVDFMSRVLRLTPAETDQQHIRMLVEHNPKIPNRQLAIRGNGEDPGPIMASMARRLEAAGADLLVMPCNLAHAWCKEIESATSIPFVSIIEAAVSAALQAATDNGAIGLMTTPGCFAAGLYQQQLEEHDCLTILPTADELRETMALVNRVKAGDHSAAVVDGLRQLADALIGRGATVVIAACTEFPLVLKQSMFSVPFISSTDELAKRAVAYANGFAE